RFPDGRLFRLQPPSLLERHCGLSGHALTEPGPTQLVQNVGLAHPPILPEGLAAAQGSEPEAATRPPAGTEPPAQLPEHAVKLAPQLVRRPRSRRRCAARA